MHNIILSALLPLFWADKSSEKCGGLRPSKFNLRKIMKENLEVIFLASLFFVSVLAIAPVS